MTIAPARAASDEKTRQERDWSEQMRSVQQIRVPIYVGNTIPARRDASRQDQNSAPEF